jgi:RNA polymerase sigma-70 factor (ECF subfamily)
MRAVELSIGPARTVLRRRCWKEWDRVHSPADDEALLVRVAGGDRDAFARLFAKFAPKVKGYLMRLGAAGAIAEDLAQDALGSVWRRAGSFDRS